jgi:ribosome-associated protein
MTTSVKTLVLDTLDNYKALNVKVLDVRSLTSVTDTMIIATGNSNRHTRALAQHILEKSKENDIKPVGMEGDKAAEWILIDLDDVVVHIMLAETREFYALEKLWQINSSVVAANTVETPKTNITSAVA